MTVTIYKWTIDRYHQAIQAGVFEGQPVELLRGEIITMPPEGDAYAASGIQEYWVVSLKVKQLHIFKDLQDGQYGSDNILKSGTVSPMTFEDIKIQVQRLM